MANQLKEELVLGTQQFDTNINKVIKKVEELKHKGGKVGDGFETSMGKMIERATGFNGQLSSLTSVVGKFGGALGVAMGAGDLFNRMLGQSREMSDGLATVQQTATSAVDYFARSLVNCDFSNFLNGLSQTISLARQARQAIEDAATAAMAFGLKYKKTQIEYNGQMDIAMDRSKTKAERDAALKKANQLHGQLTNIEKQQIKTKTDEAIQTIISELGGKMTYGQYSVGYQTKWSTSQATGKEIQAIFSNPEKYLPVVNNMRKALKDLNNSSSKNSHEAAKIVARLGNNRMNVIAYNLLYQKANNEAVKSAVELLKSAEDTVGLESSREKQMGNTDVRINGNPFKTSSGSGGRSRGGSRGGNNANVVTYTEDSLAALEAKLSALQANLRNGLIPQSDIDATYKQIEDLKKRIYQKKIELRLEVAPVKLGKNNTNLGSLEDSFSKSAFQVNGLDSQTMQDFNENVTESIKRQTQEQIDAIRQTADAWGYYSDILGSVGQAMSVLGDTTEAIMAKFVVSQAAAVAQMIMQLHQIIAANQAAAMAKGIQSASGLMFPYNLAAIATVVAAIAGTFASLPKFAEGGIVGGSSFGGDRLVARVNSGEMILNGLQQKHLFDLLDGGGNTASSAYSVEWKLRGSDLYGSLKNYSKGAAKTNKITGIL